MKQDGRCVTIQVSLAGQVAVWALGFLLMAWGTIGDSEIARAWALMCVGVGASWTIVYTLTLQHRMIERTIELDRAAAGQGMVRPIR